MRSKTLHNAFFALFSEECFTICLTKFYCRKTSLALVRIMLQHYELLHQFHLQERPHQSKPYQEYRPELYRQFNRRSRYVSTGINIPVNDWDFAPQTAVQRRIYEQIEKYDKCIKRLEALVATSPLKVVVGVFCGLLQTPPVLFGALS